MRKRQTWRVTQNVSLRPIDVTALQYLMDATHYEHASAVVRLLIAERMRAEIGRDWEAVLAAREQTQEEGALA